MVWNMLVSDIVDKAIGTCIRFGLDPEVYWVKDCLAGSVPGKVRLKLSSMSGQTIEKTVDAVSFKGPAPQRVDIRAFFSQNEICPLCSHSSPEPTRLFSVTQLFWEVYIVKCRNCGLVYKEFFSRDNLLKHIYSPGYCHTNFPEGLFRPINWQVFLVASLAERPPDMGLRPEFRRKSAVYGGSQAFQATRIHLEYLPDTTTPGKSVCHFSAVEGSGDTLQKYQARVKRLGKPRGCHLDYGCGVGDFVAAAVRAGWDSYGADPYLPEIASDMALSKRLYRLGVSDQSAQEVLGKFDCISMWGVVEHLVDLRITFEGLMRLLNPKGHMVFNSPNARSLIARKRGRSGEWPH